MQMKDRIKKSLKNDVSGSRVIFVLILNAVIMAAVYIFFAWFLGKNRNLAGVTFVKGFFTYREVFLCLVLGGFLSLALDYAVIIRPLWELEDSVKEYLAAMEGNEYIAVPEELKKGSVKGTMEYLMRQQKIAHEREVIESKQRKRTELYALQMQIDPHFLYNALDSIRGYALLHDMDEISDITEALSRVFRNMISNKNELLPLRQEMDNIKNYMKIQQFRFNNKFQYAFEIEDEVADKYMVPRMVLQPLVENAIMHGLEHKIEGGWVLIRAYVTQKRFILSVTDNGAGISESRLELLNHIMAGNPSEFVSNDDSRHVGIALININRRIKLNFGKPYGITLSSTPEVRTTSEVVLPLLLRRK